jgi:phage terminase large subunit-like protein
MDKGAVTSWATVRSLYNLMRARAKSRKAFNTEMQGDPRTDEDKVFTDIQFWVRKPSRLINFAACDPSMGKNQSSDPSAILVGGLDLETLNLYVYLADIKRRVPSKLKSDLIAYQKEFNCQAIGFENNNAYEFMRTELLAQALQENVYLPLVGVTASVPLEIRIESLEPVITGYSAKILLHSSQTQLLDELDTFPEKQTHHHYDGLSTLHILWGVAVSRSGGLPQIKSRPQRHHPISGY